MSLSDGVKYVQMPWEDNTSIIYQNADGDDIYLKWNLVKKLLSNHINDVESLIHVIRSYNVVFGEDGAQSTPPWSFKALREVVELMDENVRLNFFSKDGVLSTIRNLALSLPDSCRKLKILVSGVEDSITLHQMQIASILANAFFCTFPRRRKFEISFHELFEGHKQKSARHVEKLKCFIHYFSRIHQKQPGGYITFHRRCTPDHKYPRWDRTTCTLCPIIVETDGRIEDQLNYLQMDFANRMLGGGVLGWGCVQEEIRFVICPELIASRLFIEPMTDNEACIIIGAERYCNYTGYADTFKFQGDYQDQTPFDSEQRRNVHILAVDAINFRQPMDQYRESRILREIKKIYTGLAPRPGDPLLPLATGNWGCGAYRGDPELKSLLQIMAASKAGRRVAYYTFGNEELKRNLLKTHAKLVELNISVGQLHKILVRYNKDRKSSQSLFHFVVSTAIQYANAYSMARNHPPEENQFKNAVDSAQKRSSPGTVGKCVSQNKFPRRDSHPWPMAWLEKEKPKTTDADLSQRFQTLGQSDDLKNDTDSDDFIPATPDVKRTSLFSSETKKKPELPSTSLLDALEEDERKNSNDPKPDVPSTSLLNSNAGEEKRTKNYYFLPLEEKTEKCTESPENNPQEKNLTSDSNLSISSSSESKTSAKKPNRASQTRIDSFFQKKV